MKAIWGKNLTKESNITLGFFLDLNNNIDFELTIVAKEAYKIIVDSELKFFGPMRSAHGYSRPQKLNLKGRKIAIEVYSAYVVNFCWVKEEPLFSCEVKTNNKIYNQNDFISCILNDRVKKVPRYCVQRTFEEIYNVDGKRESFYNGIINYPLVELEEVEMPRLLDNYLHLPKLNLHKPNNVSVETGYVQKGEQNKYVPIYDRCHTDIDIYGGYYLNELDDNIYDEVKCFEYTKEKTNNSIYKYKTISFNRSLTGFLNIKLKAKTEGTMFITFDEVFFKELGEHYILFSRNSTTNAFKWNIKKIGEFNLSTFEPYTFHYLNVIYDGDFDFELSLTDYENPDTDNLEIHTSDVDLNLIIEAARHTISQNAVDLLTDCPSRERSGWLSDSYFSSTAEKAFTGENIVEKAFLENYSLSKREGLPKGMIYMNYPSDLFGDMYIPNWSLWYILELTKYAKIYEKSDIIEKSKETVYGLFEYFKKYENEYSMLENLESWVFVEWSKANDDDHIKGVNIPSNMCYQKVLEEAGKIYNNKEWIDKSNIIKSNIKKMAYNGTLFVDNLIRNENNELVQTNNLTEVCQYYGFYFEAITKEEYNDLYDLLMNKLGPNRKEGFMMEVCPPNMMYGIYMRLDLLMRDRKRELLLKECKTYFLNMAKTSRTLWEHNSTFASLNHAFASYSIRWIIFSLFSYDIIENKFIENTDFIDIKATCKLPLVDSENKYLILNN